MPAHKPYEQAKVGAVLDTNYKFLDHLFGERKEWGPAGQQQTLRDYLLSFTDEAELRAALEHPSINIKIAPSVGIVLFDVESVQVKKFPLNINPASDLFYVLVLPPKLRRETATEKKACLHRGASLDGGVLPCSE